MLKYFYHEVVAIEGKGLGCVATRDIKKNTLILQEIPQIFLKHDIKEEFESWVTKLMYQFNRMSKKDQKDFLKLPTKPKDEKKEELNIEEIANTVVQMDPTQHVHHVKKSLCGSTVTSIRKQKLCMMFDHDDKTAEAQYIYWDSNSLSKWSDYPNSIRGKNKTT